MRGESGDKGGRWQGKREEVGEKEVRGMSEPYLFIRNVYELKEENQTDQYWLAADKSKTGVEIILVHEEAKQEQRQQQVELKQGEGVFLFLQSNSLTTKLTSPTVKFLRLWLSFQWPSS